MSRATIRGKGQVTLPADIRAHLHLSEGDGLEFTIAPDGGVSVNGTTTIPSDQTWFWTERWQAGEREASGHIARGGGTVYESGETFLASLPTGDEE